MFGSRESGRPGFTTPYSQNLVPSRLEAFLAGREPGATQTVEWETAANPLSLSIAGYLGEELPPLEYVSLVRAVVFRGDQVLVMRNADGAHFLPGGQREGGETLVETLGREVLGEAGWTLDVGEMLGFLHLHHLGPEPEKYRYPYPDFAHVVFLAEAKELGAVLAGRLFLDAAVRLRRGD